MGFRVTRGIFFGGGVCLKFEGILGEYFEAPGSCEKELTGFWTVWV